MHNVGDQSADNRADNLTPLLIQGDKERKKKYCIFITIKHNLVYRT